MEQMNNILLVQLPPWGIDTPPLGIATLATYMRHKGFSVQVFDINIDIYSTLPNFQSRWKTNAFEWWASGAVLKEMDIPWGSIMERIHASKPALIGCSATFASVPFFNELSRRVRAELPSVPLVVGGGAASYELNRSYFAKGSVDWFIIGEGEEILARVLTEFGKGGDWKARLNDPVLPEQCLQGTPVMDLDALPFPLFDDFPLEQYAQADLLPISMSRGCINACNFCCDWGIKRPYRSRTAGSIVAEMKMLVQRYHRRRFESVDLLMNGDLRQLEALCDRISKERLEVVWGGQIAVRDDMSATLFTKMKQAGCGGVTIGFETVSDPLLKRMNKRFRARDAAQVITWAQKAGMIVEINLLVGFPGEEESDIDETLRFLDEHRQAITRVNSLNICSLSPGMPLWDRSALFGIDKTLFHDWYAWHTADGSNTLELRLQRHRRMKEHLQSRGWRTGWENVREGEGAASMAVGDPPARTPKMVSVLMTLQCSLRCKMCALWKNTEDESQRPDVKVWERFFDSLALSKNEEYTIVFGGGEPLLFVDELVHLIAYARHKGFRTSLATSGYLLTEESIDRLAHAGLQYIAFTVYSLNPRVQDHLRGVKGSLQKVKKAIEIFHRRYPAVEIAIDTVLMEPTRKEAVRLARWVEKHKAVSRVFFQAVMQPFHTKPVEAWYQTPEFAWLWPRKPQNMVRVIETLQKMRQKQEARGRVSIANAQGHLEVFKQYFKAPEHFIKRAQCPVATSDHITVMPDGTVSLCPFMAPIGSISDRSLYEVLHSDEARKRTEAIRACKNNCHHIVNCWFEEEH